MPQAATAKITAVTAVAGVMLRAVPDPGPTWEERWGNPWVRTQIGSKQWQQSSCWRTKGDGARHLIYFGYAARTTLWGRAATHTHDIQVASCPRGER